jgi:2-phospho-L-lactate guanylyltransferase (CobY/MobA/RfbA family)
VIGTAYGPSSARAHTALAQAAGVRVVVREIAGLALDVDTPGQLRAVADLDGGVGEWARALRR